MDFAGWGTAPFSLAWVAVLLQRIVWLPFGLVHSAMGIPLTALTLCLTVPGTKIASFGMLLLALTTLPIVGPANDHAERPARGHLACARACDAAGRGRGSRGGAEELNAI